MNIKSDMTVEQYNQYCVSFFTNFNKDSLNEQIEKINAGNGYYGHDFELMSKQLNYSTTV